MDLNTQIFSYFNPAQLCQFNVKNQKIILCTRFQAMNQGFSRIKYIYVKSGFHHKAAFLNYMLNFTACIDFVIAYSYPVQICTSPYALSPFPVFPYFLCPVLISGLSGLYTSSVITDTLTPLIRFSGATHAITKLTMLPSATSPFVSAPIAISPSKGIP